MKRLSIILWLSLLIGSYAVTGCATQREIINDEPLAETRLIATRSAENVTLSWQSEPGMNYTVLFNNTRSARSPWRVLPGGELIRGNGRMITLADRVSPQEERLYRLQTTPQVNRR